MVVPRVRRAQEDPAVRVSDAHDRGGGRRLTGGGKTEDHFSGRAEAYARYRPTYPTALYEFLSAQCEGHTVAWDCGTGNGQAAVGLSEFFGRVVATDRSVEQLALASPSDAVLYAVGAEDAPIRSDAVDLVTAAAAVHWFDIPRFYAEARRVLRPAGVIAIWAYGLVSIDGAVNELFRTQMVDLVKRYWPPERVNVDTGYRHLPFPFQELEAPALHMQHDWTADEFLGYLGTWSAVRRYRIAQGKDPVEAFAGSLREAWGDPAKRRTLTWPIHLRVGRVP